MRRAFLDTSFLFAAFFPDDALHAQAIALTDELFSTGGAEVLTTRTVLVEFLTLSRKRGAHGRVSAGRYVQGLLADPAITCVPDSIALFDAALALYIARPDKAYSMTDCIAMIVCKQEGISDVLTHDKDFAQEGFVALLRETA